MYCTNCGKEIDSDSKVCGYCGTPIKPLEIQPVVNAPTYVEQPIVDVKQGNQEQQGYGQQNYMGQPNGNQQVYPNPQRQEYGGYGIQYEKSEISTSGGDGAATASLIMGIMSLFLPFIGAILSLGGIGVGISIVLVNMLMSIVGIILGSQGRKAHCKGRATAGLILAIIGLVLTCIVLLPTACFEAVCNC